MRSLRLLVVTLALAIAGCGVPLQDTATPIEDVSTPSAVPSVTPTGPRVDYWFVAGSQLVAERGKSPVPVTVNALIEQLAVGPPPDRPALRSLVVDPSNGTALVTAPEGTAVVLPAEVVTVQLNDGFGALPPSEQPLLLGQVVMTLTGAGAGSVLMTDARGTPVSVPLPDGRLHVGPATRADYQPLTLPPEARAPSQARAPSPSPKP